VLLVTPAPLTITANDAGMVQGAAVPPLSASYSGFANGDSPASLAVQPTVSTPATSLSPAGAYPIAAGGARSPNYAINYGDGVLVVTPAPVRVSGVSIQKMRLGKGGKPARVIVLQFSGALNTGDAEYLGNYSLATDATGHGHRSKVVALSRANYNPIGNTVTLVTRKPLASSQLPRLTIYTAGLLDTLGRSVDGDGDGQPGGNCVSTLRKQTSIGVDRPASRGELISEDQ
jgi:hypothetical protein